MFEGSQDNSFGKGSVVERDNDIATGELIWSGQVRPDGVYFMRITNDTEEVINYWIFPEDVVNANLQ